MKYIENNIQFNNVKPSMVYIGSNGPLTAKSAYRTDEDGNIIHRNGDYLINAIDIHWNGAQLDNVDDENLPSTITSTAELLTLLNDAYKKIGELSQTIVEMQEQLNNSLTNMDDRYQELASNLETLANSI